MKSAGKNENIILSVYHAIVLQPTRKGLVIEAFSHPNTWYGVSLLADLFELKNTNEFSFKLPIDVVSLNFVPAVSWKSGNDIYRFKLWDAGILYYPVYDGRRIGPNAKLEIWNINNAPAISLGEDWLLRASELVFPDVCSCVNVDVQVAINKVQSSPIPPYTACNPFCVPICYAQLP